jgi:hypothetical protein
MQIDKLACFAKLGMFNHQVVRFPQQERAYSPFPALINHSDCHDIQTSARFPSLAAGKGRFERLPHRKLRLVFFINPVKNDLVILLFLLKLGQ